MVPIGGTRRLDEKIKNLYSGMPEKYQYIEYPDLAHDVTMEMKERAIGWCKEHF